MGSFKHLFFTAIGIFMFSSCAKVYYSPDAEELAENHQTIAVIPPTVSIAAHRNIDADAMIEQQRTESTNFQNEIYAWLLRRNTQGRFNVGLQVPETTNIYLERSEFSETGLTRAEMCEALEVDGIIASNFALSRPMSQGAAIALGVLVGVFGSTNEVRVTMSIDDCSTQKMIWNYEHKYSGGLGSTPASLVNGLMRNASRKMPYLIEE